MFSIDKIIRENIRTLTPYSSARDEFMGTADIYLDANENSIGSALNQYNRYPDPLQRQLKEVIGKLKKVSAENIFLGNGSDECIDLLYRCFCEPGRDNVIICPPTYGMYEVSANINSTAVKKVPLTTSFDLDEKAVFKSIDAYTKIIWICSPNNPTGNDVNLTAIENIARMFEGLVVIDEAYIDFSPRKSCTDWLNKYDNVVVLQTFSKAWGLAGLRLGMAFAATDIIQTLNKVKPPYNINEATQQLVLKALKKHKATLQVIDELVAQRNYLELQLTGIKAVEKVNPSDANFLLIKCAKSNELYRYLLGQGIVVRDRSTTLNCENCLRITVGTAEENRKLLKAIRTFYNR